jgi:hypothetical protein
MNTPCEIDHASAPAPPAAGSAPARGGRLPSQEAVIYLTLATLTAVTVALLALGILPMSAGAGGGCGGV